MSSSSGSVVARFTLTPAEYAEGMRAMLRRQPGQWGAPVAGSTTLVLGAATGQPIAIAGGIVALGISAAAFYLSPVMRFKSTPRLRLDQVHTFSGTGISVRAGEERGNLPWGFYLKATETKNVYVLMRNKREGNFVPKTAFASETDEARFRDLVADHMRATWRA